MQTKNRELSTREKEIYELKKEGYSERQIAIKLRLSRGTVHEYVERIRKKIALIMIWGYCDIKKWLTTTIKIDENMI